MQRDRRRTSDAKLVAGVTCLVGGTISAELAWLHARSVAALGEICGQTPSAHCLWCPTAVGLFALGTFLVLRRVTPEPRAIRIPSRRSG